MTFERLRRLISYDPHLGHLIWLTKSDSTYAAHQIPGQRADGKLPFTDHFVILDETIFSAASICVALQYDIWRDVEVMDPDLGLVLTNLRVVGDAEFPPPKSKAPKPRLPAYMRGKAQTLSGFRHS